MSLVKDEETLEIWNKENFGCLYIKNVKVMVLIIIEWNIKLNLKGKIEC